MTTQNGMVKSGLHTVNAQEILGRIATGLTATGSTQATAYALDTSNSVFTTVAASTGAILPAAALPGDVLEVTNLGANSLSVYPPVGAAVDNGATNAAKAVAVGKSCRFRKITDTLWVANLSA
jgi:acetamidase/formamidase